MVTTVHVDENNDLDISNLNRTVRDIAKQLDIKRKHARNSNDFFSNSIEANRCKLLINAERLMFTAPKEYGRQCEEFIWRKGFYETYTYVKQLKADAVWTNDELCYLQNVFNSGIGFYHHLLMRIQEDFHVDLSNILHFPMFSNYGLEKFEKDASFVGSNLSVHTKLRPSGPNRLTEDSSDWTRDTVYRCLIYLGDLNRYMLDIYPGWNLGIASEYYWRAVFWKPDAGQAFNQLAALSNYQKNIIDTVYYYLRCLCSLHPFEVAQGNLMPLVNQHITLLSSTTESARSEKAVLSEFCGFVGIWFFRDNMEGVQEICLDILDNLNVFYKCNGHVVDNGGEHSLSLEELTFDKRMVHSLNQVFSDTVFKILVICCMCHYKRSQDGVYNINPRFSPEMLITAIVYHMVERMVINMKVSLPELKLPPAPKKKDGLKRLKRRRRHRGRRNSLTDDNSSENSDTDIHSGDTDDESEEELIFDTISDDEESDISELKEKILNGFVNYRDKNDVVANGIVGDGNSFNSLMRVLEEDRCTLQAIKVAFDWLECNTNTVSILESWTPFMENLVLFLNYVSGAVVFRNKKGKIIEIVSDEEKMQPLAEDLHLRSCSFLHQVHQKLNWNYDINNHTYLKQMRIRVRRFIDFGIFLSERPNSRLLFDSERCWFAWMMTLNVKKQFQCNEVKNNHVLEQGRLLSEITDLWLEEERKQKEERALQKSRLPLLVLDGDTFLNHYRLIRSIVFSKRFLVVVPSATINVLDEAKTENSTARDSVRWLENQFRCGNPLIRIQRESETRTIPNVTYPKKRDRKSWSYMEMLECCYYMTFKTDENKSDKMMSVTEVWFLTGSKELCTMANSDVQESATATNGTFNLIAAIKAIDVRVDHIGDFHERLKNFQKSCYGF